MKEKLYICMVVAVLLVLFPNSQQRCFAEGYIPTVTIQGDVENPFKLKNPEDFKRIKIEYKGKELSVLRLEEIIEKAVPAKEDYELVFTAIDGFRASIPGSNLEKCYLYFSEKYGWEAVNLNHPVSSNIKHLKEIMVVSKLKDFNSFSIILPDKNLLKMTPGQLFSGSIFSYPCFEGTSSVERMGVDYQTSVYTVRKVVSLEDFMSNDKDLNISEIKEKGLVIGGNGQTGSFSGGFLELKGNQVDYINPDQKERIENCRGIIFNIPLMSNKDAFYDTLYYLESGRKVMVVMLDGFGFHQYQYAFKNDYLPFLSDVENVQQVLSVYRPVTNAGLAAILTGKGPEENGVFSRKNKKLLVPDLFEIAAEMGFKSLYIEGNIKILNTGIEPLLNPDLNGNGTTDDEVFNSTLENINGDFSLVFVHFHGIDDSGHDFGDLDRRTMEVIKRTDSYLQELIRKWSGIVIITADHGMHSIANGGAHGSVLYQDMFVPYIILDGREYDE